MTLGLDIFSCRVLNTLSIMNIRLYNAFRLKTRCKLNYILYEKYVHQTAIFSALGRSLIKYYSKCFQLNKTSVFLVFYFTCLTHILIYYILNLKFLKILFKDLLIFNYHLIWGLLVDITYWLKVQYGSQWFPWDVKELRAAVGSNFNWMCSF